MKQKFDHLHILVVLMLVCTILSACSTGSSETTAATAPSEQTLPQTEPPVQTVPEETVPALPDFTVDTPYGSFVLPGEWENHLLVEDMAGETGTLHFAALMDGEEIPLFDLYFNGIPGELLGYIRSEDGAQLRVSLVVHDPELPETLTEEETTLVWAMHNGLNEIIAQMDFVDRTELPGEEAADIVLHTPACDLHYPLNWQAYLDTQTLSEEPFIIRFTAVLDDLEVDIFDVILAYESDAPVGTFTGSDGEIWQLSLTYHDFTPDDSWSDDEKYMVYAMVEDVNYMLDRLVQTNGFTFGS